MSSQSSDKKLVVASFAAPIGILLVGCVLVVTFVRSGAADSTLVAAAMGFTGVVVTACTSVIGLFSNRQAEKRLVQEREAQENRLRMDAAMRAGELLSGPGGDSTAPAAAASGLLALAKLEQEVLAVTLLVDLWNEAQNRISTEAAILVIDAALRSHKQWRRRS